MARPRISFGIIVLNGEPFTRYCLRSLYPFAHEIIVVEGAVRAAASIATPDGHSTDGTVDTLRRFKSEEDNEGKVKIISRTGFWSEKEEQSQAYATQASGDYLWQVDIDEFYTPEDLSYVMDLLAGDPEITAVSFQQITFWGGFDYVTDGWYLRRGDGVFHRLFKWRPGYTYAGHRPPTVKDGKDRDLRTLKWVRPKDLGRNIRLYHYSLVFPKQVLEKSLYYTHAPTTRWPRATEWAEKSFSLLQWPFRIHNVYIYPSWLLRFKDTHPPAIQQLIQDIRSGILNCQMRPHQDIEGLLRSVRYRFIRACLLLLSYPYCAYYRAKMRAYPLYKRFKKRG